MPSFSNDSKAELYTCDQRLIDLFNRVVETYDCTIIEGYRDEKTQNLYFHQNRSKVQFPDSSHNSYPSKAADVAPYPIEWNNTKRFYHFAGFVQATARSMGFRVRWGGDWDSDRDLDDQTFFDLVHFELVD